jgi:predicted nucleotide-binding protein
MYELGIAHTVGKETIMIYQKNKEEIKFPFDIAHIRRIEYENTATGGKKLERDIKETIKSILEPTIIP